MNKILSHLTSDHILLIGIVGIGVFITAFIDNNMQSLVYDKFENSGEKVLYEGNTSNEKANYHTSVVTDVYGQSTSKTINGLVGIETHLVYLEDKQNLGVQNRVYRRSNHYQQKGSIRKVA
ncbi:hypothetical protein ACTFIR_000544 [Dictyostelium discoideum]